jgi:3-oxoacyl-[acyl-carrier-protein] synthase II
MKRVVITGIGAVTPLGNSFRGSWEAALEGKCGIGPITRFDALHLPWRVAGELKGFDASPYLGQKEIRRADPFVQYAVAAAMMAVEDAGLTTPGSSRTERYPSLSAGGVIIGSSRGGISTLEHSLTQNLLKKKRFSAYLMPSTTIGMAASYVAMKLGACGYCLGVSNACASGANAIGEAFRLIKNGFEGPLIAGGSEAPLCRLCLEGYGASGALSRTDGPSASRPFDRTRDGFVLSEGACIVVLEERKSALRRGASIYGEVLGYGNTADTFHQTRPSRDGVLRAMRVAIEEAGLSPEEIDYISAHGTSTPSGDRTESEAINALLGNRCGEVMVSAIKSMTGHMLAASGALEAAFAVTALKEGTVPPTINLAEKAEDCGLNLASGKREAAAEIAISNSFGFGGVNAVLIFGRYS